MNRTELRVKQRQPAFSPLERAMNMWCCFFLAAGLLLDLYKLMPKVPLPSTYLPWAFWVGPAICLLLIVLVRNFRLVGLPLGILLVLGLPLKRNGDVSYWEKLVDFMGWLTGNMPYKDSLFYWYNVLLHLLPALLLTLCIWLLLRRRSSFVLLLAGSLGIIIGLAIYGVREHSASLYLLAAGLLPLVAASAVERETAARGMAAAISLPLTAVILFVVLGCMPADTDALRWRPLSDKVDELKQSAIDIYWTWRLRDVALDSLDLMDQYHIDLGGPVQLNNVRMLLVKTDYPQLLKASTYDYYDSHGWMKSSLYYSSYLTRLGADPNDISRDAVPVLPGQYEFKLEQIFGTDLSVIEDNPLAPFIKEVDATVTLLHPKESRLFYWGQPTGFSSPNEIEALLEENSELKTPSSLNNGYRYTFSSLIFDRNLSGFTAAMAELSQKAPIEVLAKQRTYTELQRQSMVLPLSLVLEDDYLSTVYMIKDIVNRGLEAGKERSLYEQAVMLERWLKENCIYSVTPVNPPEDQDFVMHFLQTREGYCTYYATAMVVMSRMIGIPARYITGYKLQPTTGFGQYEATNATAHAWAELYFNGVGWLPFDPTGQVDFTETRGILDSSMTDREFFGPATTDMATFLPTINYSTLAVIVAVLLVVLTLLPIRLLKRARLSYNLPGLLASLPHDDILELYYRDMVCQLDMLGWRRNQAETILSFVRRLGGYLPEQARQLRLLGTAVCAWRYGGQKPEEASLHNAKELHEYFESLMRQQLKGGKYFRYRLRHSATATLRRQRKLAALQAKTQAFE